MAATIDFSHNRCVGQKGVSCSALLGTFIVLSRHLIQVGLTRLSKNYFWMNATVSDQAVCVLSLDTAVNRWVDIGRAAPGPIGNPIDKT